LPTGEQPFAHVARRKAQYLRLSDPSFALETARRIVDGKLRNMADLLLLRARQYRAFLGDRMVLAVLNRKAVAPEDFVYRKGGDRTYADEQEMAQKRPVEMKPATRKTLVAAYEAMMARSAAHPQAGKRLTYRNLILQQVREFERYLSDPGQAYEPFRWEG